MGKKTVSSGHYELHMLKVFGSHIRPQLPGLELITLIPPQVSSVLFTSTCIWLKPRGGGGRIYNSRIQNTVIQGFFPTLLLQTMSDGMALDICLQISSVFVHLFLSLMANSCCKHIISEKICFFNTLYQCLLYVCVV